MWPKRFMLAIMGHFLAKNSYCCNHSSPSQPAVTSSKCQIPAGCWHQGEELGGWEQCGNYPRLDKVSSLHPPRLCTLALPSTRRDSQGSSLTTSTWLRLALHQVLHPSLPMAGLAAVECHPASFQAPWVLEGGG